jgi:anti-sigma regulatory factor (Ser/Thr protein kinase)
VRIVETCKNPGGCRSERVFPAQLAQLAEVRRFFRHFCQTKGDLRLSEEQLDRFELALNEVVSNVIRHSFAEAADREFILNLCACAGRMEAMVVHNGTRYSPSPVVRPPEGSLEESGYGLSIIKQAVDEVLYDTDDAGRNTIFLSTKEH